MEYQPLTITEVAGGEQRNKESFLLPGDAFPVIENMYVWRDRLKRREPASQLGRLRRILEAQSLGNSGASPWSFNIFTLLSLAATEPDAAIERGSVEITVGVIVFEDQGNGTLTSATPGNSGTINYSTGAVVLTHTAGAGAATTIDMNYFPGLPVMGLYLYNEGNIEFETSVGFDTKYAYIFDTGTSAWQEWIPGFTWTGDNLNFFWGMNTYEVTAASPYLFWATNFNEGGSGDPIRWTEGTTWTDFAPALNTTGGTPERLQQCLAIVPWKNHLLAFNTWEGQSAAAATQFPQRVRWSIYRQDPTNQGTGGASYADSAWNQSQNLGGSLDASTSESIVSVSVIRDTLIVGFERSTWALRYLGEQTVPFAWERINSEFGVDATYSPVRFDTGVLQVGSRAITTTDGNDVSRLDEKIPDQVFLISPLGNGGQRTYGIRDYQREIVLWTFSSYEETQATNNFYPDRTLLYNYRNGTWATLTEGHTCFGYHYNVTDETWESLGATIIGDYWARWNDAREVGSYPYVIGGNQQGFVMIHGFGANEGATLMVQAVSVGVPTTITSPDHNLITGDIVSFVGMTGTLSTLNSNPYQVAFVDADSFRINEWDGEAYQPVDTTGLTYSGGGEIRRIYNFDLRSKNFNLLEIGSTSLLGFIDFLINVTDNGEIACDIYGDWSPNTPLNLETSQFFNQVIPTSRNQFTTDGIVADQHRFYCQLAALFFQFRLYLNDDQINDLDIAELPVTIQSMTIWAAKAGRGVQ